jgi:hypothetical protein
MCQKVQKRLTHTVDQLIHPQVLSPSDPGLSIAFHPYLPEANSGFTDFIDGNGGYSWDSTWDLFDASIL